MNKFNKLNKLKKIVLLWMIFGSVCAFAAKQTDLEKEKVYQLKSDSTELKFKEDMTENKMSQLSPLSQAAQVANEHWYFAISRSGISYHLPTLVSNASDFSNDLVGLTLGKKQPNLVLGRSGFLEYSLEWQRYERHVAVNANYDNSQELNLLKVNFYQNFPLVKALKNFLFISAGLGFSPVMTTVDQSVLSNSAVDLGFLFTVKTNFDYPIHKKIINFLSYYSLNLELALSMGEVGGREMRMSSIKLGSNFNW